MGPVGPQGPQGEPNQSAAALPDPNLAAAITAEIQPVEEGGLAYVDFVTVTTYPHRLTLTAVTTLQGKAPISWAERADASSCPNPNASRPGGLECRQRFRVYYSYDTCQFDHSSVLTLRYTTGAQADVHIPFQNHSNNWCNSTSIAVPTPSIVSMTPTQVTRGNNVTLTITTANVVGSAVVVVNASGFTPASAVGSVLTVNIPASFLQNLYGLIPVSISTGGGTSNVVSINVQ